MIIAVDFDGVIHDWQHPKPGRRMGPPVSGAKDALIQLKAQGHTILIHSCNRPSVIYDWMKYYEVPYDTIWDGLGKPKADRYLDDRAVKFTDWSSLNTDPELW